MWSAGTHSKRVKWSALEKYVFLLPSPEEQLLISDFFSKILKLKALVKNELRCVLNFQEAITQKLFEGTSESLLGDFYELINTRRNGSELPNGTIFIGLESISSKTSEYMPSENPLNYKSQVIPFRKGDVLYGKLRPNLQKVLVATFDGFCSTEILVMRPKVISAELLCTLLRSNYFYFQITCSQNGTVMPRVHERDIARIPISDLRSDLTGNSCEIIASSAQLVTNLRLEIDLLQTILRLSLEAVLG
jgi:restriction endonuclease S subunit